jgi:hypothetical protein
VGASFVSPHRRTDLQKTDPPKPLEAQCMHQYNCRGAVTADLLSLSL